MADLSEYFKKVKDKLDVLKEDIQRMGFNEGTSGKKKDMKSLQPVTRMRGSIEEAKEASANPETTFIVDLINDAFKG